ncbi:hypothetical protein PJL15_00801 [Paenarthrobacter nitroguajacolicus]|nr:hypothetical protein [Paenarthrobacter nitroguajacolicus]
MVLFPTLGAASSLVAVDDFPPKLSLVHTLWQTFSQVRALIPVKEFLYPQSNAQSVHNVGMVFHSLSTGAHRHLL